MGELIRLRCDRVEANVSLLSTCDKAGNVSIHGKPGPFRQLCPWVFLLPVCV